MEIYKPAKTTEEMISYLETDKRVRYNNISKEKAQEILFRYNYINVITPFKHVFAEKDKAKKAIKVNGRHQYNRDVEFSEYYSCYKNERDAYPTIFSNISEFENHFKSITEYHIMNDLPGSIKNSDELEDFINRIKLSISLNQEYKPGRKQHMIVHVDDLMKTILKYHDVYCFFDRISLGPLLTLFIGLDNNTQNVIFQDMKRWNMNLGVDNVGHFIDKVFTLVGIRNCVYHNNSLEVLIRFYDPKTKQERKSGDRKKYVKLVELLSKEKQPTQ